MLFWLEFWVLQQEDGCVHCFHWSRFYLSSQQNWWTSRKTSFLSSLLFLMPRIWRKTKPKLFGISFRPLLGEVSASDFHFFTSPSHLSTLHLSTILMRLFVFIQEFSIRWNNKRRILQCCLLQAPYWGSDLFQDGGLHMRIAEQVIT